MFHYLQFLFCEDLGNFAARVELGREPAWKPRVNFHNVNVWLTNFLSCLIRRIGDTTLQPIESHPATEVVESDAEEPGQAEEEPDAPAETADDLEKIRLEKALPAVPTSPPAPAATPSTGGDAASTGATVNSSTHKQSYMRFARFGKSQKIHSYPEMARMWNASGKQKQELFAKWVQSQEDPETIEGTLKITASQKKTGEAKQELLTVPEMRARGLSEAKPKLSLNALGFRIEFLCPYNIYSYKSHTFDQAKIEAVIRRGNGVPDVDCPTSIADFAYWVTTSRTRTELESVERVAEATAAVSATDVLGVLAGVESRVESLTGVSLPGGSAPATTDLLKFVKESAAESSVHGSLFSIFFFFLTHPFMMLAFMIVHSRLSTHDFSIHDFPVFFGGQILLI